MTTAAPKREGPTPGRTRMGPDHATTKALSPDPDTATGAVPVDEANRRRISELTAAAAAAEKRERQLAEKQHWKEKHAADRLRKAREVWQDFESDRWGKPGQIADEHLGELHDPNETSAQQLAVACAQLAVSERIATALERIAAALTGDGGGK